MGRGCPQPRHVRHPVCHLPASGWRWYAKHRAGRGDFTSPSSMGTSLSSIPSARPTSIPSAAGVLRQSTVLGSGTVLVPDPDPLRVVIGGELREAVLLHSDDLRYFAFHASRRLSMLRCSCPGSPLRGAAGLSRGARTLSGRIRRREAAPNCAPPRSNWRPSTPTSRRRRVSTPFWSGQLPDINRRLGAER